MSEDSSGFFSNLRQYATEYVETKRRNLQAKPQTQIDGGGSRNTVSFGGQEISQSELREIKNIRESGGIISSAFDAKALIRFGTGTEFYAENDELKEWLDETFPNIDLLTLELGEDATYYPYTVAEIVENRVGEFDHIRPTEPWTMLPRTDKYGDVIAWEQHLSGEYEPEMFDADELGYIILNKSSARDKTGISDVLQNKEEIETFRSNQQAMREATERLGFPFIHAKAGREGATQLNDNELRRIRNRLADIGPGETQVTGPDVDIDQKDPATVDFGAIQERDTRMLANAISIPLEMLNEGSDGLGSGKPAEVRLSLFALQNEAARRRFCSQFEQQFLRPIVEQYSPYDHTQDFGMDIKPFLDDKSDMAEYIERVGKYMRNEDVVEKLDLPTIEDEEMAESYRPPKQIEEAEEEEQPQGGLFGADGERALQDVEDIALDDYPEAAQENARMALDAREETGNPNDCLTDTGWAVANNLDSGDPISESQLESMSAFERFEEDKEQGEEGQADCGWMAWKAWGGDEGIRWAENKQDEFEEARENAAGNAGFRDLAVPDEAVSISDRSEAPEGAEIVEGKRGGLYYIPPKDSEQRDDSIDVEDVITPDETVPDQSEIPSDIVDTEELGFDVPEDRLRGDDFMNVGVVAWDMDDDEAVSVNPEVLHFNEPQLDGENIRGILDADPDELPPLEGYQTSEGQVVVTDGNHRAAAAKIAGWDEMDMKIVDNDDVEGVELSDIETEGWDEWETCLFELHQQSFEAEPDVQLANFTETAVPDFVKDRLQDAIMQGAIFSQFDTIADNDLMQLREFMTEQLVDKDGWTTDGIANRLQDLEPELSKSEAETIARTETASIVNTAREEGYQETGMGDEDYYWVGGTDSRTTEACNWLMDQTNPNHGGNPVSLDELKELIEEAPEHDPEMQDNLARPDDFVVHPNERKTFVRDV